MNVKEFYYFKYSNQHDVTQDVLLIASITHYVLKFFRKTQLHALCIVFKYFHVEASVSTTKNNTTGSFYIIKKTLRRHNVPHSPAHIKSTLIIWLYPESFKLKYVIIFFNEFFVSESERSLNP